MEQVPTYDKNAQESELDQHKDTKNKNGMSETKVKFAQTMLKNVHKLKDTYIEDAYPWLKYCGARKCRKKLDKEADEKEALIGKDKKEFQEDPLIVYGYGVTAFKNMKWSLLMLFLILTVLNIPILVIYMQGGAYEKNLSA
jgi:hypothetical protein